MTKSTTKRGQGLDWILNLNNSQKYQRFTYWLHCILYVHIHIASTHTHTHTCTHMRMYADTHTYTHSCTSTYAHIDTWICTHACMCVHTYMYTCMNAWIQRTHMHAHTHTHPLCPPSLSLSLSHWSSSKAVWYMCCTVAMLTVDIRNMIPHVLQKRKVKPGQVLLSGHSLSDHSAGSPCCQGIMLSSFPIRSLSPLHCVVMTPCYSEGTLCGWWDVKIQELTLSPQLEILDVHSGEQWLSMPERVRQKL